MDKPHCKRLLCACIIVITLLCTFLINAEFIAAHHSEYHNLLNESSFEPVDMEKITLQKEEVEAVEWFDLEEIHEASAYRIAPPSTGCCHNHNISMCESKISVLHDVLISIGYEIKNSDTLQILSVLAENNKTVLYDVITYLGRYLS